jgi:hypothetical protein
MHVIYRWVNHINIYDMNVVNGKRHNMYTLSIKKYIYSIDMRRQLLEVNVKINYFYLDLW